MHRPPRGRSSRRTSARSARPTQSRPAPRSVSCRSIRPAPPTTRRSWQPTDSEVRLPVRQPSTVARLPLGALLVVLATAALSACVVLRPQGYGEFKGALKTGDALKIYDTLEALIANDNDTRTDRKEAWHALRDRNEDTAAFQFAWAAVAGRYVQNKGLLAVNLLKDIE